MKSVELYYLEDEEGCPTVRLRRTNKIWFFDKVMAYYDGCPTFDEITASIEELNRGIIEHPERLCISSHESIIPKDCDVVIIE